MDKLKAAATVGSTPSSDFVHLYMFRGGWKLKVERIPV